MKIGMALLILFALFLPGALSPEGGRRSLLESSVIHIDTGNIIMIQFSPDGTRLATAGSRGIRFYDPTTCQEVSRLTGHTDWVNSIVFSPDGRTLVSGSRDGTVLLWDPVTGEIKRRFAEYTDPVKSVRFSPDGTTIAIDLNTRWSSGMP